MKKVTRFSIAIVVAACVLGVASYVFAAGPLHGAARARGHLHIVKLNTDSGMTGERFSANRIDFTPGSSSAAGASEATAIASAEKFAHADTSKDITAAAAFGSENDHNTTTLNADGQQVQSTKTYLCGLLRFRDPV